jgi:cytochrome c553
MKKVLLAGLAGLVMALAAPAQAADVAAGQAKSAMCAACHGADGNSAVPTFPKLAGQGAKYAAKQLAEFKSGARVDPSMKGIVMALTEEDMANLGAYFSSQAAKPAAANDDGSLALGENVYRGGITETKTPACLACHGPTGQGNDPAVYPSLAGQHATYTAKALRDFRSGARANDPNGMMRDVAKRMTDAEIDAVANYIQGLN